MYSYKKTDVTQIIFYLLFGAGMLFLRFVGNSFEPFSLSLAYALPYAGVSPLTVAFLFFTTSCFGQGIYEVLLAFAQAILLLTAFLLHNKFRDNPKIKTGFLPFFALTLSLGGFVAFSPFTPYYLPFSFALDFIVQKIIIASFIFLLTAIFSVAVSALIKKCLKCRLKTEELIFSVVFFVFIGVGACRLLGLNAYMGIAFFILLVFAYVTKDASALLCAFVLALPPTLSFGAPIGRFFLYAVAVVAFVKTGRILPSIALLSVFFFFGYLDGLFYYPTNALVSSILSVTLPTLFFMIFPTPLLRAMENKLVFYREKHLSRVAINRNRASIGKQLFEIASVFRDIETTFSAFSPNEAEASAKEYIQNCVVEDCCKGCSAYRSCMRKEMRIEIAKLVEVGCLKGKTSLIDVPKRLSDFCINQSNVLYAVNKQLGEYKKYMLETENASSGRALLARQAQGVNEILCNLALEQSEPLRMYTEKERTLTLAFMRAGIVCSEVLIYGEEQNFTVSLITFGRVDVKKIATIVSHTINANMMISERIALSHDKYCCILRKKPFFDASFGVASAKKTGESVCGDTHSVIKIDERRFMVALADGMGSGEYASRISESTVSLLESFYKAKIPSNTVLSTVNKLLTFNQEEAFACVDIAIVDLDDGKADVVKIGTPVGFILSGSTVKVLESQSLPLGILNSLRPDTSSYVLQENDVLLFLSDGITGAFGSTSDLYETLKTIPISNPQQLADSLLASALQAYGGIAKDDMTAVAIRLFKSACVA